MRLPPPADRDKPTPPERSRVNGCNETAPSLSLLYGSDWEKRHVSGGMLRPHNAESLYLLTALGVFWARAAGGQINSFTAQCGGFELTVQEQQLCANDKFTRRSLNGQVSFRTILLLWCCLVIAYRFKSLEHYLFIYQSIDLSVYFFIYAVLRLS